MTLVLFRRRAWGAAWSRTEGWGARSKKPSEGSRSRVRRTPPMDFQSIFGWKSVPEAGFGKNVIIDAHRCSGSLIHLDHPNARWSVVQDRSQTTVSNACISHALASAARAASLCAGHAQQLGGESPSPNLMEVKGSKTQGLSLQRGHS